MKKEKLRDVKLLRYIGRISIAFCQLEDDIEHEISQELHDDFDDLGYLITCKMNFQQKIDLYERLITNRFNWCNETDRVSRFTSFIIEINDIKDFRNHIIHSIRFNDEGELFLRQKYSKKMINFNEGIDELKLPYKGMNATYPKFKKIELNEAMLKKILRRIEVVSEKFSDWEMQ